MKMFKWLPGRQPGVDYKKFCFLALRLGRYGFDGYILKYPANSRLPEHTDPIAGKMWRLNITLWGNAITWVKRPDKLHMFSGIGFFRPDIHPHGTNIATKTTKLSLGFAKFDT